MGFFDRFPYSDPYQLNLDWIIAMMKKFEADYNQLDPDSFLRKSGGDLIGTLRVGDGGSIDMRRHSLTGIASPVASYDAANKEYVDRKIGTPTAPGAYLPLAGGSMSGDIDMDGHGLTGIQNPIGGLDAVNKAYVDAIRQWALTSFAPNGYGLGVTFNGEALSDANTATKSGWYKLSADTVNGIGSNCVMRVDAYGDNNCFQTVYLLSSQSNTFSMRQCRSGVWHEWEWENPPMALGVEYKTTRRCKGYPIFTKRFTTGEVTNGTNFVFTNDTVQVVEASVNLGDNVLPYYAGGALVGGVWSAWYDITGHTFIGRLGTGHSVGTFEATVDYIKI